MTERRELLEDLLQLLECATPGAWSDCSRLLASVKERFGIPSPTNQATFLRSAARGTAFLTFDYGIDGVSIEIAKYASCLADLFGTCGGSSIHFVGGDFHPQADAVIRPEWHRYRLEGSNGWGKWDHGTWFSKLYYEDMPEGSSASKELAREMYGQAVSLVRRLGKYVVEHGISLLIPVNIASNPGNLPLAFATAALTEALGVAVINSNHDFYWEGGKAPAEREAGEPPGIRDHFFRNASNESFFSLFRQLYPWNGRRWLQANINARQSRELVTRRGFATERVCELSTCVGEELFRRYSHDDVTLARLRMGHILSGGSPVMHPVPIAAHRRRVGDWMQDQQPLILGAREGLTVDPTSTHLMILLQPTRVIARKRIERELQLLRALLVHHPFRSAMESDGALQIVLHITGPTPIEHRGDLETVLDAYEDLVESESRGLGDRFFLAFSVGREFHPSFAAKGYRRMGIADIYRMASAVVFPSETEGRGLPIVEASACGIPLICSRYHPHEVFGTVVGEGLPEKQQIRYTLFPDGDFTSAFLDEVTELLLRPETARGAVEHNREAVRGRYSRAALRRTFEEMLDRVRVLNGVHCSREEGV